MLFSFCSPCWACCFLLLHQYDDAWFSSCVLLIDPQHNWATLSWINSCGNIHPSHSSENWCSSLYFVFKPYYQQIFFLALYFPKVYQCSYLSNHSIFRKSIISIPATLNVSSWARTWLRKSEISTSSDWPPRLGSSGGWCLGGSLAAWSYCPYPLIWNHPLSFSYFRTR